MKHIIHLLLFVFLTGAVLVAGEEGWKKYRCPQTVETCLNMYMNRLQNMAWDGILVGGLGAEQEMFVKEIQPNSPGEKAGIKPGDLLHELNGVYLGKMTNAELEGAMAGIKPGQEVDYVIIRDGKKIHIKLSMAGLPTEMMAGLIGKHMIMGHAVKKDAAPKAGKASQ